MPIPKPASGENESEFVSRCISKIIDEYDQSQAAAICYNAYQKREEMSKKEELYVLSPRKSESRGKYLTRCSANSKIKAQFGSLKERLGYCMNSFNEYYKYWAKIEMSEVPMDTVLGECIAKNKARGLTYQESYARCASKVVVQPTGGTNPVVMEAEDDEDNLIIEPVL
jgi:hypothetical protein